MPDLVRVEVSTREGTPVAAVVGEVDMASVGDVRGPLLAALDSHRHALVVDLTGTTYLDSAAVSLVFELGELLRRGGGRLHLVVPEEALVRRALELTSVHRVIPVHPDLDAALAAVASARTS